MLTSRFRILVALGCIATLSLISAACENHNPTGTESVRKGQTKDVDLLQATQRPIAEFVDVQGTYCWPDGMGGCVLFVPPVENFFGWSDPALGICAAFDYAGLADEWITGESGGAISFGTTTSGSVTETTMADGRAELHIRLHTRNALTFAVNACNDFGSDPLLFGHRAADVLFDGKDVALGDGLLHLKIIIPEPGAPMPDLIQLAFTDELPGYELRMLSIGFNAAGTLRAPSGYPDGTSGRLSCTQRGLFFTNSHAASFDGFPVESIRIKRAGNSVSP